MKVVSHFPYTGKPQRWTVPAGVTSALIECWGAAGGQASYTFEAGKERQVVGASPPANNRFTNNPAWDSQLGVTYANNAGYTAGVRATQPGEVYYVYVGGNGGQGFSSIMLNKGGKSYSVKTRGGPGGWNGGGDGGVGAAVYQALYNGPAFKITYKSDTRPASAKRLQYWYDTKNRLIKRCNKAYTKGNGADKLWTLITKSHEHTVGGSGGGGGGATDVRLGSTSPSSRIMAAGGSGGAGGPISKGGTGAWPLARTDTTPAPLGSDIATTKPVTGADSTYASAISYYNGGIGHGGLGGGVPAAPAGQTSDDTATPGSPTPNGGRAVAGADGGGSRYASAMGTDVAVRSGQGHAGTHQAAGLGGAGTPSNASGATGGNGGHAPGQYDDWCAGGGGGGGGYLGGGGGGWGWRGGEHSTWGGGGGGGSSYVGPQFSAYRFLGGIRPPHGFGNAGTGANGLGGFARITYRGAPVAAWGLGLTTTVKANAVYTLPFTYAPAVKGGAGVSHYQVGTALDTTADEPTAFSTFVAPTSAQTVFVASYAAPAAGVSLASFVRVIDTDGDTSPWIRQVVLALAPDDVQTMTITSPPAGAQLVDSMTVTWDVGPQHPLAAYKIGVTGTDLVTKAARTIESPWHRGGSRVNFAADPGFLTTAVWSSTVNADPTVDTTYPGVSGSDLSVSWYDTDAGDAEIHSTALNNLRVGTAYRFHIDLASALAADPYPCLVEVWDSSGLISSTPVSLGAAVAGTYVPVDFVFTPRGQGVYFVLKPSLTDLDPEVDALLALDFEDTTVEGFSTGASDVTQANSGDYSLKVTSGSTSRDITAALAGAGQYVLLGSVYAPSAASTANAQMSVTGPGVAATFPSHADPAAAADWQPLSVPFAWNGTGAVTVALTGDAGGFWWDDVEVHAASNDTVYGNASFGQVTYLANMLVELSYVEDAAGVGPWFSGTSTGADVVTDVLPAPDTNLSSARLTVRSLTVAGLLNGYDGSVASIPVLVNASLPAPPAVALEANSDLGLMRLAINAVDSSAAFPTVYFDILRDGVRVATGLKPDVATRLAAFWDTPGHGQTVVYTVRAFDAEGGYVDVVAGAVTQVVNGYHIDVTGPDGLFREDGLSRLVPTPTPARTGPSGLVYEQETHR